MIPSCVLRAEVAVMPRTVGAGWRPTGRWDAGTLAERCATFRIRTRQWRPPPRVQTWDAFPRRLSSAPVTLTRTAWRCEPVLSDSDQSRQMAVLLSGWLLERSLRPVRDPKYEQRQSRSVR